MTDSQRRGRHSTLDVDEAPQPSTPATRPMAVSLVAVPGSTAVSPYVSAQASVQVLWTGSVSGHIADSSGPWHALDAAGPDTAFALCGRHVTRPADAAPWPDTRRRPLCDACCALAR